jgi:predicted negative regulator of RcsB-dependent stress response
MEEAKSFFTENLIPIVVVLVLLLIVIVWFVYKSYNQVSGKERANEVVKNDEHDQSGDSEENFEDSQDDSEDDSPEENSEAKDE